LLKRFQPFGIRRISQSLRLLNLSRFNYETSILEDNWRFYTEMPDGNLRIELDLIVSGRVYTLNELMKLVNGTGWKVLRNYGGLLSPAQLSADTPSIVLICKRQDST